jgi:hypothetical protein
MNAQIWLLLDLIPLLSGIMLIIGAYKRWKWLVDPPPKALFEGWLVNSQAVIKKYLGKTFLLYYTYLLGIAFTIVGILIIYRGIMTGKW